MDQPLWDLEQLLGDPGACDQVTAAGNTAVCRVLRDAAIRAPIAVAGNNVSPVQERLDSVGRPKA